MNKTLNDDIINTLVKIYEKKEFDTILIDIQKFIKEYPSLYFVENSQRSLSLKQFD